MCVSHLAALLRRDINTMGVDFRGKESGIHNIASIANEFTTSISFT